MTTEDDWKFRESYFRDRAKALRAKAHELECEAAKFDDLADQAKQVRELAHS